MHRRIRQTIDLESADKQTVRPLINQEQLLLALKSTNAEVQNLVDTNSCKAFAELAAKVPLGGSYF